MTEPIGTCCIVLHSHLPWLAHHGSWPVGEEWLYQSWAASYLPVVDVLDRLADEGRRDLLTLAVTPVLAAQLDDPYCLRELHTWLGFWQVRAEGLGASTDPRKRELGSREFRASQHALRDFESRWRHGASPVLRRLVDSGAVELLGGPATHPFQPLLDDRVAAFALSTGLDDTQLRVGTRPDGIWAPECGYRPSLEDLYADAGVQRFLVDGPTLLGAGRTTADAWTVGGTDVVAFGRDLDVTYRVWSPRRGYPGGPWYRDFHTYDHASGFHPARVTSTRTAPEDKAPYDPERAAGAVAEDAADFVSVVRQRLVDLAGGRDGRPALVTVAYDTELFGHWWHEGPAFLEAVLRLLPEAGVRVTTLRGAVEAGHVAGSADLAPGSWGSGKDWRVWEGEQVADLVDAGAAIQKRWLDLVGAHGSDPDRRRDLDQLARDALLALSSDWAFMVTKDSAAGYARDRFAGHEAAFHALARAIDDTGHGHRGDAIGLAARQAATDGPFAHLDARLLRRRTDTL
ncbi:MAG TPA: glycoside hydrolase family 57 protein [Actinomycetes bacterium]